MVAEPSETNVTAREIADVDWSERYQHIQHPKKRRLLEFFCETGTVSKAARAAGCSRWAHRLWLANDPEYADAFALATQERNDWLEEHIITRVEEKSDLMLIFAAKGAMPEKYRDANQQTINVDARTINIRTDDALEALLAAKERLTDSPAI